MGTVTVSESSNRNHVVRDMDSDGAIGVLLGFHLPVREDDGVRRFADRQRYRLIALRQRDIALPRRVATRRADGERKAAHGLLSQQRVFAGQELSARAAQSGYVDGFIVHGSKGPPGMSFQ